MAGPGRATLVILALAAGIPSLAAGLPDPISKSEYRERRVRLVDLLREELSPGESGVLLLRATPEAENSTYRQESNLYYLSGTEIPGSSLVLIFDRPAPTRRRGKPPAGHFAEYLYLPPRDYGQERWTGPKLGPGGQVQETLRPDRDREEAMRRTGFDRPPGGDYPPRRLPRGPVESASDLPAHLDRFLSQASVLFHLGDPTPLDQPLSPDLLALKELRDRHPFLMIRNPDPALARMRMIKSPAEIEQIRRAVEITCLAQQDAMRAARGGMAEYQVQAEVERRFTFEGARRPGYPSIIASGSNSCVLHYDANDGALRDGEVLLMDVGAEYQRYSADVTRTVPVSGRFTAAQRRIYDLVLKAQEAVIAAIRPGLPFSELDRIARAVITEGGYGDHFIHGTSHFIGLDVHDLGDTDSNLQPGMVLTVEPGIYLPGESFGVRIEDDVLVTQTGAKILSDCLPRTPDAVEMQMSGGLGPGNR